MFRRLHALLLGLLLTLPGLAQSTPAAPTIADEPASAPPPDRLSIRDAVVLGIVEGVTEFVPVSSTGHLIITNRMLGLDATEPLRDQQGNPIWFVAPSPEEPEGIPVTLKLAADTYIVVIQIGAIFAVVLVFWSRLVAIARGLMGQNAAGARLLRNIILAFLPVVVVGLALDDWIDAHLFSIGTVIAALVVGAGLMFAAERWRRSRVGSVSAARDASDLSPKEALQVGLMQCLALWPGMSRSMVTMVGGYWVGLPPPRAAEFAFLVGLPVLGGAALYKGLRAGPAMIAVFGWPQMVLGAAVATVSAAVAVRFLVAYLSRFGLGAFAIYRIVLAVVLAFWFYF